MSTFDALEFAEVKVSPVLAAQVPGESSSDPATIAPAIKASFGTLATFVQQHELVPSGPPRTIYTGHGPDGIKFTVVIPIAGPPAAPVEGGPCFVESLPGARAMRFTHRGPYAGLMETYGRITEFLKAKGLMTSEADWAKYMPMWEEYHNDPHTTPESELLTHIYLPVA
jgi:effector-binding domain-containing protein